MAIDVIYFLIALFKVISILFIGIFIMMIFALIIDIKVKKSRKEQISDIISPKSTKIIEITAKHIVKLNEDKNG